jgi:hypothetical protein
VAGKGEFNMRGIIGIALVGGLLLLTVSVIGGFTAGFGTFNGPTLSPLDDLVLAALLLGVATLGIWGERDIARMRKEREHLPIGQR